MDDCIFCRIGEKKISADVVYEDDQLIAFKDLKPQAPIHVLFIPKKHMTSLNDAKENDTALLGNILLKIKNVAASLGVSNSGYRVVINCNKDAGQEVAHIHAHLLGGRKLNWPPG